MADIDFDELDKAVNNLMGDVKDKDKMPEQTTVDIDSTLDPDEKLSFEKLDDAVKSIGDDEKKASESEEAPDEEQAPPRVNLAARPKPTTGRFMDMVHPSADMRTTGSASSISSPALTRPLTTSSIKDESESNDTTEPDTQTPFLPDANEKISKRPLGAVPSPFSGSSHDDEEKSEKDEKNEKDERDEPAEPTAAETLSVEPDVVKDTDTSEHQPEKDDGDDPTLDPTRIEAEPTDQDRVLQSIESIEVEGAPVDDEPDEPSIRQVESADTENLRTDDGKDEPVKSSESASGIYDVKDYHKPLSHTAPQRSGWGTVIVIIAIIVICVAVAAAVFFILGGGL